MTNLLFIGLYSMPMTQYQKYFDEITRCLVYNTGLMMINHNLDPANISRKWLKYYIMGTKYGKTLQIYHVVHMEASLR